MRGLLEWWPVAIYLLVWWRYKPLSRSPQWKHIAIALALGTGGMMLVAGVVSAVFWIVVMAPPARGAAAVTAAPTPAPTLVPTAVPTLNGRCWQLMSLLDDAWGEIRKEDKEINAMWSDILDGVDEGRYGEKTEQAMLSALWKRASRNVLMASSAVVPREFRQYQTKWVEGQNCFLHAIEAAQVGDTATVNLWIEKQNTLARESTYAIQDALEACLAK